MNTVRTLLVRHVVPLAAGTAVLVAAVAVLVTLLAVQADKVEQQRDDVGNIAVEQALTIERVCAAGGEVAAVLAASGQCAKASDVQATVSSAGVPLTITVPVTAVVDQNDLLRYVRDQVAAYCAQRNECVPPTSLLVDTVAAYLRANPPPPGRAPTESEIRDAARGVITADPDLFRGPPGQNASDDQVAAQVAAYCAARGDCRGPQGDQGVQGVQGVSVQGLAFSRDDSGRCVVVVTLLDPADGSTRTVTGSAGDAACDPVPTSTTTDDQPGPLPTP